eukprot:2586670-Pyramimonas_sp.AAC.1
MFDIPDASRNQPLGSRACDSPVVAGSARSGSTDARSSPSSSRVSSSSTTTTSTSRRSSSSSSSSSSS